MKQTSLINLKESLEIQGSLWNISTLMMGKSRWRDGFWVKRLEIGVNLGEEIGGTA